jgi:putative MATE family efflux protein
MSGKPLLYASKGDLTNGPVRAHLIRMAVPMVWSIFSVMAVQLANTWFISMLGTTELAAIGYTFPVAMVVSNLVFGINIALSSVVSRLIGEKKIDDVRRVTLHGIMLGVSISGFVAIIAYVFLEHIFHILGADETVMPVIRQYMPLWLISSVILAIPINANSAIRASGDTFQGAIIMVGMALMNFLLDPILIFGWFGVPHFGVAGGAISTIIAYSCAMAGMLYVLIVRKNMVSTDSLHLDKLKDSLKRLVHIAIPAGLANIIQPLTGGAITALLAIHGHEAVAAFGVAQRVEAMAMLAIIALAVGLAPIVGQNWGAAKYERVHEVIGLAIKFNFIWSFFMTILMALGAAHIARTFSDDPNVIHDTTIYFWIMPFTYAFGNLVFGWSSAFNSMGMPQRALTMIVFKSIITIPAAWLGGHLYGVAGIFAAMAAVNMISGIVFHFVSKNAMLNVEKPGLAPEPLIE